MILKTDARRVASEWHDGQASALYAFSSTGTITENLLPEINANIAEVNRRQFQKREDYADMHRLTALRDYVKANQ